MTERPILFSAPMVRAILDGRKTQTRRVITRPEPKFFDWVSRLVWEPEMGLVVKDKFGFSRDVWTRDCPYGMPGDQLWVRETWQSLVEHDHLAPSRISEGSDIQYPATYDGWASKHRPSIHMPRWMSRLQLEVTGVRVERLNAISEADAVAEGIHQDCKGGPISGYQSLWDYINGAGSWDANPWVWVVEFRLLERRDK